MQRKGVYNPEKDRCCGWEGVSGKEAGRRRSMQAEMQTTVLGGKDEQKLEREGGREKKAEREWFSDCSVCAESSGTSWPSCWVRTLSDLSGCATTITLSPTISTPVRAQRARYTSLISLRVIIVARSIHKVATKRNGTRLQPGSSS